MVGFIVSDFEERRKHSGFVEECTQPGGKIGVEKRESCWNLSQEGEQRASSVRGHLKSGVSLAGGQ